MKKATNWQSWNHLRFQYDPGDRHHILDAASMTLERYNDGLPAIGHNHPPRSGKSSLIHVLAVELQAAGAPFVHALTPWSNLAEQLVEERRLAANCRRLGFKGWTGKFMGHQIKAVESSRYWQRMGADRGQPQDPWTLITSTVHLVHSNCGMVEQAVSLAVEESGGQRPVFIVDETHLLPEMQKWADTLLSLQTAGAFIVSMTGTASRADGACIVGFRNEPVQDWEEAREVAVVRRGEPYQRDSDGTLVRDIVTEVRWGQERLVETVATGHTVGWDTAFERKWLHPVSAEPVDFQVVVDGEVVRLSELDAKTAEKGRSEWLRSTECCRALAQKAVAELESWRSNPLTRHTKMLVVTTQDRDFTGGGAEKSANIHAREMRRQIEAAIAASPVLSLQDLSVEICTSVTESGEADENAMLKLRRFGLTAPDQDGNKPIDILIVKTMGIVGLDVPECKVQVDASSIRRGPMKKQLATRALTQWILSDGSALLREAVCIYPCDPRNHAFYQGLTATSEAAKEKQWEDSIQETRTVDVKPADPTPELVENSGQTAGYINEGGKWLEGDYDRLIARIRAKYPATSVLRKIDVVEMWRLGAFPGCDSDDDDDAPKKTAEDDWANRIVNTAERMRKVKDQETFGKKANRLANRVYSYIDNREKWARLVQVLQSKAKRRCRISPDVAVDRIQDYAVIERLKTALDEVLSEAVSEVARA